MMLRSRKGQATVEMGILFAAVIAALTLMNVYLQHAAQGGAKSNADSLGTPFADAAWNSTTNSTSNESSGVTTSNSDSTYTQTIP